ncbi:polyamine ABC transporter substrate-binding protein [Bradyrhizobium sp. SSUT112]|uniref:polyamine ABC transporter substrate-binding protein n=1 Tax=Bradyrhizobium sp. SSUT112 TaxID=3040604 RepID=UPI00244B4A0E|nr:polyamine ABC transporter substrate-binding protein [Bradyrhizobium sp. SSUT112]MDH2357510.1 polyamine ABC transporter substrate-binding protein [Bradyrhizobium sp. SSUT112]
MASASAVIGLVAATFAPAKLALAGDDQVTVTSAGGGYQKALRTAIFEPFVKATGIKLAEDEWSYELAKIRAMVETKTVSWDVVETYTSMVLKMCQEDMIEKIDWNKLGLDRTKFMAVQDCGVPTQTNATILAYDKDRLPNGPKTIADLFDTKKFPGKRGLWKSPIGNLEWALIADGVPIKDVPKVLNTPDGVDRAFKKLDTIKKDIIWWTAGSQAPQLLADGQVVMTAAFNARIYDAVKNSGKNFEIVWDAEVAGWSYWVIPKGSPRRDNAYKFIAFAASPEAQANLTRYTPAGPANIDAMPLVNPAILPHLANAPEHLERALEPNVAFWVERRDELTQRFTAWLAK